MTFTGSLRVTFVFFALRIILGRFGWASTTCSALQLLTLNGTYLILTFSAAVHDIF